MKSNILDWVDEKENYMAVMDAIVGTEKHYTDEDKKQMLDIYAKRAVDLFGFTDQVLLKALIILDTAQGPGKTEPRESPVKDMVSREDLDGLSALCDLYADWQPDLNKAEAVKTNALSGDMSETLALALARAALDVYAGQKDLANYREDIAALAGMLKGADEAAFSDASAFLIRVRERVR